MSIRKNLRASLIFLRDLDAIIFRRAMWFLLFKMKMIKGAQDILRLPIIFPSGALSLEGTGFGQAVRGIADPDGK